MFSHFYLLPYGIVLQAIAIVHFIRRRPDGYWLWIIIFGGGLGALVYIVVEVIPDAGLLRGSLRSFGGRSRIRELEAAVHGNPSAGNFEELGGLYLDQEKFVQARQSFDRAIAARADSIDSFYRRGLCEFELKDFPAAVADFERVVATEPAYDFHRAATLLAASYARTGQTEKARTLFERVTRVSTTSELQFHYAWFLAEQNRADEAREWAGKILAKKRSMPGFQRRRERPWFRRAAGLIRQLPRATVSPVAR
jgi:hypothetical protein